MTISSGYNYVHGCTIFFLILKIYFLEISKVRVPQTQEGRVKNAPKNSLFFQPATKTPPRNGNFREQINQCRFSRLFLRYLVHKMHILNVFIEEIC